MHYEERKSIALYKEKKKESIEKPKEYQDIKHSIVIKVRLHLRRIILEKE